MSIAKAKHKRDNNKISKYYLELMSELISGDLIPTDFGEIWTSNLTIYTNNGLLGDSVSEFINRVKDRKSGDIEYFPELLEFIDYGLDGDMTCATKGWAIDSIADILISKGLNSFLINFGGDIFGYNTKRVINIEDTKFNIKASGTFSIFTSGNTIKRGNHIKGGPVGEFQTIYFDWKKEKWNNTQMDILSTKLFSGETECLVSWDIEDVQIIKFNEAGKCLNKTYCASPFFDKSQVEIRDKMISSFQDAFRPDLTKASKEYSEGDSSKVEEIYLENVSHVASSEVLVFPMNTTDLGTLYEVGYAIASKVSLMVYNEELDLYHLVPNYSYKVDDVPMIFDLSKKSHAISMGYASKLSNVSNIRYQLNGCRDNIMMAAICQQVELIEGKLKIIDKSNARPD